MADPAAAYPLFHDATRLEIERSGVGELEHRDGWLQITTPDAPVVWRNMVHHAVLSDDEADARIDEIIAHYAALEVPFLWRVTPLCRPLDLGARLMARGFGHFETLCCMTTDPADHPAPDPDGPVVQAVDAASAERYIQTSGDAWGMPEAARERFRTLLARELDQTERNALHFLVFDDGQPAGTGSMSLFPRSVHFSGSAVLDGFRGRGLYRALILERMRVLRAMGRNLVSVHAVKDTSAPILRRMGFRDEFEVASYEYAARA